ncbi:MAG: hypothetical protein ACYC2I_12500 [Elusimicrobiales bacterium]
MSKKHDQTPAQESLPPQPSREPAEQKPPVSSGVIWTFWGGVLAALIAARALDLMLPAVPERVIERWVMLAFAVFLAAFLVKLK